MSAEQPDGLLTRAQVASELGVQPNRITKWVADGAPVARRGARGHSAYYDLESMRAWVEGRRSADPDETVSLTAAKTRQALAQAEKYERENLVRAGQLIEREQVVAEGQAVLASLKAKLLAVPRLSVMRAIVPREKEHELHSLIVDTLRELVRWKVGDEGADPPAAEEEGA